MELVADRRPAEQLLQLLGNDNGENVNVPSVQVKDVIGSDRGKNNWGMANAKCNNYERRRTMHGMMVPFPPSISPNDRLVAWRARDRAGLSAPSFTGYESNWGSGCDQVATARFYACSFCSRQFGSAQALGGHMNVHRHERAHLVAIAEAACSSSPSTMSDTTILLTPSPVHSVGTHSCPSLSTSSVMSPAATLTLFNKPSVFLSEPPLSPSPPLDLELRLGLQPT